MTSLPSPRLTDELLDQRRWDAVDLEPCSLYSSPRWLDVQVEGGRAPSRLISGERISQQVRGLLPVYDALPTRNERYSLAHLLRGFSPAWLSANAAFGGLLSGYLTEIAVVRGMDAQASIRALLQDAMAARPNTPLLLPYASNRLAAAIMAAVPATVVVLEAADAWLINPGTDCESFWSSLPSRTRYAIDRDERLFAASKLESAVLPLRGHIDQFAHLVSLHASRYGLSESPVELSAYLSIIANNFGEDSILLAALDGGRLVAAALGLIHGKHLYVRMVGNDQFAVAGSSSHFVLTFYNALRLCAARGLEGVHLGLNIDRTKRSRGAKLFPLWTIIVGATMVEADARAIGAERLRELSRIDPGCVDALRCSLSGDGSAPA